MTYPLRLLRILSLRHPLSHPVCVDQRPLGELEEDTDLGEYVKFRELFRGLLRAEGVAGGCFGHKLSACVFVKYVWTEAHVRYRSVCVHQGFSHVRPLCDETNLSSARPISDSFSDGPGLTHSVSRSYTQQK